MGISDKPIYNENAVIEFRTRQVKPFKQLLDIIKNKLPETSLLFNSTCMRILQVDTAQTFLVDVRLDGNNFEHYYCDPEDNEYVEISINSETLVSVFKTVDKDDSIFTLSFQKNSDNINIMFQNTKKDEIRSFNVRLQNPESINEFREITPENLEKEYEYCMSMPTTDLEDICKTLKNIKCNAFRIVHDNTSLCFISDGDTQTKIIRQGTVSNVPAPDKLVFNKMPDNDDLTGPYSARFKFATFSEFSKSNGNNKIVEILMSKNSPIILHYEVGDLGEMYIAMVSMDDEEDEWA